MSDFYNDGIGRRSRKDSRRQQRRNRPLWQLLGDGVMWLLTLVLVVASAVVIMTQYLNPEGLWLLPTLVTGAPIIYIADIVAALYWVVRWRGVPAAIMGTVVIVGAFYMPSYYNLAISRRHTPAFKERNYTKLVTYNVANGKQSALVDSLAGHKPDIICLQEFLSESWERWEPISGNYRTTYDGTQLFSCEIFVKSPAYRILRKGEIPSLPRYNAVWADVAGKRDTVRVINLHLQSTGLMREDTHYIEEHRYILSDGESDGKLHSILTRLAENSCRRAIQADSVRAFMERSPYRTIVCGDINDVPLSYTYRRLSEGMNDAFTVCGDGYAHTFDGYFSLLRIDHVFVAPGIEVCSYEVDEGMTLSDHYPVIIRMKFNEKQ